MNRDAPTLKRRGELCDGFGSMKPDELLETTRRALLRIYTPQQTAIWLDAHASGEPMVVARKALRLSGGRDVRPGRLARTDVEPLRTHQPVAPAGHDSIHTSEPYRPDAGGPRQAGRSEGEPGSFGSEDLAASERLEVVVHREVTTAVRALFACQEVAELQTVLFEIVTRLGGRVIPAEEATEQTLPADLMLGTQAPLLITPDPQRPEMARHLHTHIPQLIDDAHQMRDRLEQAHRLESAAERDSLTGLLNRRAYERLAGRMSRGDVLVLIDLDDFKQVNDTHGHLAGDQILRIFGAVLREQVRMSEYALRIGGDEFLLVLEEPDDGAAGRLLERLHIAWDQRRPLPVEFSAGIAAVPERIDRALAAADRQLYDQKRAAGRRRGGRPAG